MFPVQGSGVLFGFEGLGCLCGWGFGCSSAVYDYRHNLTIVAHPRQPRRESCSFGARGSRFGARTCPFDARISPLLVRESLVGESDGAVRKSAGDSARILGLSCESGVWCANPRFWCLNRFPTVPQSQPAKPATESAFANM